ncbi:hypothetical protein N657DRAFT_693783 [Parathielavia appendiculata]|uniref:Uncharacterized protein n=1 Tax=Parathielavia appendiculata TaxID=2587402 RepID=A0AAN6Z0B6_9PEZI|nr:hypothetical protein N657DRAFT_693783 [Parathielavia appendiculata]
MPSCAATSSPAPAVSLDSSRQGKRAHPDDVEDGDVSSSTSSPPAAKRRRTSLSHEGGSRQLLSPAQGDHNSSWTDSDDAPPRAPAATPSASVTSGATPSLSTSPNTSPSGAPPVETTETTTSYRARRGPDGVYNPSRPLYAPTLLPEAWLCEHARTVMGEASSSAPNGSPVQPPPWFQRDDDDRDRPTMWIKDWETGAIRPRRKMDDLWAARRERAGHEGSDADDEREGTEESEEGNEQEGREGEGDETGGGQRRGEKEDEREVKEEDEKVPKEDVDSGRDVNRNPESEITAEEEREIKGRSSRESVEGKAVDVEGGGEKAARLAEDVDDVKD